MPERQPESQEEILAAYAESLTDADIPPEDEAYHWPDPDTGPPVELLGLTDQELTDQELGDQELGELFDAAPAQPAPVMWPLSYPAASRPLGPGGFVPGERPGRGFAQGGVLDELPASMALAGFADDAYRLAAALDDDSLIGVLRAWRRLASWASARELAMVAELARRRPAPGTPPAAAPGRFPVQISEFAADEVGLALTLTGVGGRAEFGLALDLADRPMIASALEAGRIDLAKARILVSMICPLERAHADAVEASVLPRAGELTTGELRAALQRAILAVDPGAARRRREAAQRDARVEHWADPEGTATLAGRSLPPAEVLAADRRLCAIAKAWKKQGAQGGMDLLRAHVYLALLLGQPIDTPPRSLLLPAGQGHAGTGSSGQAGARAAGQPGPAAGHGQQTRSSDQTNNPAAGQGECGAQDRAEAGSDGSGPSGSGTQDETVPAGLRQPAGGVPVPPLTGEVNVTIPLATLLGLADRPGEAGGFGPLHADTARILADAMARHRDTRWGVIVTGQDGRAMGWGGGIRANPVSAGGWKITLTTEPIAPYP